MEWSLSYPPPSPNFKYSEKNFYIFWNEQKYVVRIEAEVFYTHPLLQASVRHWKYVFS